MGKKNYASEKVRDRVTTISIVDDNDGIRTTLERLLAGADGFRCIGSYRDAASALQHIPANPPDIVLMDINMPGMSGIDCVRQLKITAPAVKVVMLTVFNDEDHVFDSLKAGADGYLLKHSEREILLQSLDQVLQGGAPMSPQIARCLITYFHGLKQTTHPAATKEAADTQLTERELQILDKLTEGCSYKEIADIFGISIHTVSNHLRHIYEKLHVHSRAEAVFKHLAATR